MADFCGDRGASRSTRSAAANAAGIVLDGRAALSYPRRVLRRAAPGSLLETPLRQWALRDRRVVGPGECAEARRPGRRPGVDRHGSIPCQGPGVAGIRFSAAC